ncbi:unnamed protein product [Eruca vesicaria subsp. sativa]|uniref:Uncharacterized protein n=1 Tax=Eruca vesicaria subsp. sativa TaxID=29727 RepID=A0ABC8LM40_ERUVS|nr:unnamed protein product [Eruca vesicaria subsp. sativa]
MEHSVFKERRYFSSDLGPPRPQFILLAESMICSVDVELNCPSVEVHKLPEYIPGYGNLIGTTLSTIAMGY